MQHRRSSHAHTMRSILTYIKRVFYAEQATLVSGSGPRLSSNLKSCKPCPIPPHFAKLTEKSQNMSYHSDHKSAAVVLCLLRPTPPAIGPCPPHIGLNSLAAKGHHAPIGVSVWTLLFLSSVRWLLFFHPSKRQNAVGGGGILSPIGRLLVERRTHLVSTQLISSSSCSSSHIVFSLKNARTPLGLSHFVPPTRFHGAVATRRVSSEFSSLLHIIQG